jgi:hypothetical protein
MLSDIESSLTWKNQIMSKSDVALSNVNKTFSTSGEHVESTITTDLVGYTIEMECMCQETRISIRTRVVRSLDAV